MGLTINDKRWFLQRKDAVPLRGPGGAADHQSAVSCCSSGRPVCAAGTSPGTEDTRPAATGGDETTTALRHRHRGVDRQINKGTGLTGLADGLHTEDPLKSTVEGHPLHWQWANQVSSLAVRQAGTVVQQAPIGATALVKLLCNCILVRQHSRSSSGIRSSSDGEVGQQNKGCGFNSRSFSPGSPGSSQQYSKHCGSVALRTLIPFTHTPVKACRSSSGSGRSQLTFMLHHSVMHSQQKRCPQGVDVVCLLSSRHRMQRATLAPTPGVCSGLRTHTHRAELANQHRASRTDSDSALLVSTL